MILRTDNTPTLFDNLADCLTQNYYKYYGNCFYHKNYNVGGNMNYQKMYDNLVQNAKKRSKEIEQIVKNKKEASISEIQNKIQTRIQSYLDRIESFRF